MSDKAFKCPECGYEFTKIEALAQEILKLPKEIQLEIIRILGCMVSDI